MLLFAKLLAAKEAFFKALGGSWMGLEGFQSIEIRLEAHNHFRVQSSLSGFRPPMKAEGQFFQDRERVGAQVILWDERCVGSC